MVVLCFDVGGGGGGGGGGGKGGCRDADEQDIGAFGGLLVAAFCILERI